MSLTAEQQEVAENPFEHKLVCALPGSGKTHTMVAYAGRILEEPNTNLLMVTFTNASAKEMAHRIEKNLGKTKARRVKSLTFAKVMLEQFRSISNGRRLILGADLDSYIHRVMRRHNASYDNFALICERFSQFGRDLHWKSKRTAIDRMYIDYLNLLAQYKRVDLDTVAKEVVLALQARDIPPYAVSHIIVDEYQDTDHIQYLWALCHKDTAKVCVVGDDDQSIYGWRGAQGYQNMVDFQREFDADAYLLSLCFRCPPVILDAARTLIEHSDNRVYKDMKSAKEEQGTLSRLVYQPDNFESLYYVWLKKNHRAPTEDDKELEPYRFVAEYVKADFETWAVLSRTNRDLDMLERALGELEIPVTRLGGSSIFESPHAKGCANLLMGLVTRADLRPLIEGLSWQGILEHELERIYAYRTKLGFASIASDVSWSRHLFDLHQLSSEAQESLEGQAAANWLDEFFVKLTVNHDKQFPDAKYRNGVLGVMKSIITHMEGDLHQRIKAFFKLVHEPRSKNVDHRSDSTIVLCTMTGSKGLEWPRVLLMNLNMKTIPSIKPEDHVGEMAFQKLEEERRLLYVAMTRAESQLVLHNREGAHSRFLVELGLEFDLAKGDTKEI